ncbi:MULTISPECIES: amidohydrolase family protein [unclassified Beijerinckia]|uniref:amidohydrolase family protein n=1 Tax=unclassified Beijerinckia TaxID=2638183 RepID=UPI00089625E9|nr:MULTISPECIES: amidohydrolase family protein [unclassified Beijerinckia]MDH7795136.1 L-fuconolactonase [Beijerinckia sp. GAS462]SEB89090.1 Predicted metal-dependent hydrolase, TIM-barrel fold [Beijerinckia sp. 28-YEA-48]
MAIEIVDIHPHVISAHEVRYPRSPLGGVLSDWARDRPVTPDQMVAAMDAAGVSRSALVQASTCYGYDNSLVADAVAAYPKRFAGVFSVDVLSADAPEKIRHWVGKGLSGLRLFTTGSTMREQAGWLDDAKTFPAWECAQELGIPVCVQMQLKAVDQLHTLLERFPRATVILDHLASPDARDGAPYAAAQPLFDLARYPNLTLKLTIRNVRMIAEGGGAFQPYFQKVVDTFGASRIAWGSNFPTSDASLSRIVDESLAAMSFLSVDDQEWIFRRTAERLYPSLAR